MVSQDERIQREVMRSVEEFGEMAMSCRVEGGRVTLDGPVATDERSYQLVELPSSEPWVRGDRDRLEQVVMRVVLDAIRRAKPDTLIRLAAEAATDNATI
jgi:signal transduction histidine kinase